MTVTVRETEYDSYGNANVFTAKGAGGTVISVVERDYNPFGRLRSEATASMGDSAVVAYQYDPAQRLVGITAPDYGVSYSYDNDLDQALGRVTKVYDGAATIVDNTWQHSGNAVETYSYLGAAMLTEVARPQANEMALKLTYDAHGRVVESLWK